MHRTKNQLRSGLFAALVAFLCGLSLAACSIGGPKYRELGAGETSLEFTNGLESSIKALSIKPSNQDSYPVSLVPQDELIEAGETIKLLSDDLSSETFDISFTLDDGSSGTVEELSCENVKGIALKLSDEIYFAETTMQDNSIVSNLDDIKEKIRAEEEAARIAAEEEAARIAAEEEAARIAAEEEAARIAAEEEAARLAAEEEAARQAAEAQAYSAPTESYSAPSESYSAPAQSDDSCGAGGVVIRN